MSTKTHSYAAIVRWTGNDGTGTASYKGYRRDHEISAVGKPLILGSADPAFRGDAGRYNPEELLVASLSQCHMLWYLHLCTTAGVVVVAYEDHATGTMAENPDGSGEFKGVTLHPNVVVTDESMLATARQLHGEVHRYCYIARSVNFPVSHEITVSVGVVELGA
jgi:organic hydroperoxide reductase OsmC/OhrA